MAPWPSHEPSPTTTGRGGANWRPIEHRHVLVAVVGVGDVHVVAGEHVVADLDRRVRDDPRAASEEHAVPDAHARVEGRDVVARCHAGRQRARRPDDAAVADVDVLLAVDRGHGEADHRSLAEAGGSAAPGRSRSGSTARSENRSHADAPDVARERAGAASEVEVTPKRNPRRASRNASRGRRDRRPTTRSTRTVDG